MRARTILAAVAGAAALTPAAPAAAAELRVFRVHAEGQGALSALQRWEPAPGLPSEITSSATFRWAVDLPEVAFTPTGEAVVTGPLGGAITGTVSGQAEKRAVLRGRDGDAVVETRGHCSAPEQTRPVSVASVLPDAGASDPSAPGAHLTVRAFDGPSFAASCEGAALGHVEHLGVEAIAGALDQRFFLPREATRMGKIIQLVQAGPDQRHRCDLQLLHSCSFDWSGTLTFEYVRSMGIPDPPPEPVVTEDDVPLPPPVVTEDDVPMPPPVVTEDDVPMPPPVLTEDDVPMPPPVLTEDDVPMPPKVRRARIARDGGSVAVRVECDCAGAVTAYVGGAKRAAATRRFTRGGDVRLRLRGASTRAVRRGARVRLVVTAGGRRQTLVLRLRRG